MKRGSPGAGKPHAGKYGESTPSRQRGGGGWTNPPTTALPSPREDDTRTAPLPRPVRVGERPSATESVAQDVRNLKHLRANPAASRGLTERKVRMEVDGGWLTLDWRDDGVWMTGPTAHVFSARLSQPFLDAL